MSNSSRYYESSICRQVADSVNKMTMMCMLRNKTIDAAAAEAMRMVAYCALPMSQLPLVHERFILRMIRFKPFLAMATIGIELQVPTVSIGSVLQLLDGKSIDDQRDYEKLRAFFQRCWDEKMFVNKSCLQWGAPYGSFGQEPVPYITTPGIVLPAVISSKSL